MHTQRSLFCQRLLVPVLSLILLLAVSPTGTAGMVASDVDATVTEGRAADLARVQLILEQKIVQERLQLAGLTPAEVQQRLDRLDDRQVHELALNLDELQVAGAHVAIAVILLLGIVGIIFIGFGGHGHGHGGGHGGGHGWGHGGHK